MRHSRIFVFLIFIAGPGLSLYAQEKNDILNTYVSELISQGSAKTYLSSQILDLLVRLPAAERSRRVTQIISAIDSAVLGADEDHRAVDLYLKSYIQGHILNARKQATETMIAGSTAAERASNPFLVFLFKEQVMQTNFVTGNYAGAIRYGQDLIDFFPTLDRTKFPGFDDSQDTTDLKRNIRYADIRYMMAFNTVGTAYLKTGQLDSATLKFETGRDYAALVHDKDWYVIAWSNLGSVYEKRGMYRKAAEAYRLDFKQALVRQDWRAACEIAMRTSQVYLLMGDIPAAEGRLDTVSVLFHHTPERINVLNAEYLRCTALLENAKQHYKKAFDLYRAYGKENDAIKEGEQVDAVNDLAAAYEFTRSQEKITQLQSENDLQDQRIRFQRWFVTGSILIVILVGASAIAVVAGIQKQKRIVALVNKQRNQIETKNKELELRQGEIIRQNENLGIAMTELKDAQEQLVHSEKMSSLGQLTAGLVHEINNPINFIQSGAESLGENFKLLFQVLEEYQKLDPENFKKQYDIIQKLKQEIDYDSLQTDTEAMLRVIRNGSNRTSQIISRLHRFSRKGNEDYTEFPASKPIEDTLLLVASEFKNRISVELNLEPGLIIEGRAIELEQVFMNILINASQAIEGQGSVYIQSHRDNKHVIISIRDSGPGIPDEVQKKIFDPFFTTKQVGKGMGMGLSIVHGIVKGHSGAILVRNHPEGGAEFILSLPLKIKTESEKPA